MESAQLGSCLCLCLNTNERCTGKHRGAAHYDCNLKNKVFKLIPVYFYNLAGYDSYLFIKKIGATEGPITCIQNTDEKYISFSKIVQVGEYTSKKDGKKDPLYQHL